MLLISFALTEDDTNLVRAPKKRREIFGGVAAARPPPRLLSYSTYRSVNLHAPLRGSLQAHDALRR